MVELAHANLRRGSIGSFRLGSPEHRSIGVALTLLLIQTGYAPERIEGG
jgi:hypothetical protein